MKTATFKTKPSIISRMGTTFAAIPNPLQMLRAQEQLNKFRALDSVAMADMGLTQEDLDRATLADFMPAPRR